MIISHSSRGLGRRQRSQCHKTDSKQYKHTPFRPIDRSCDRVDWFSPFEQYNDCTVLCTNYDDYVRVYSIIITRYSAFGLRRASCSLSRIGPIDLITTAGKSSWRSGNLLRIFQNDSLQKCKCPMTLWR